MKTTVIILLLSAAELTLQEEDPCRLPAETGPCKGKFPRYYYDWDSKQCLEFTYGGCEGNANNYDSLQECEATCPTEEHKEEPEEEPKEEPKVENPCELPSDSGPCKASFTKYYYNKESKKCETFVYGGCQGNENRFDTLEECEAECAEGKKEDVPPAEPDVPAGDACILPKEAGPCKEIIRKWYFDSKKKVCRMFFYGGCDGNANRFDTKEECQKQCVATLPASVICRLPYAMGSCNLSLKRFFYDFESKACKAFTYTGCEGNENNFRTEEECSAKCISAQ